MRILAPAALLLIAACGDPVPARNAAASAESDAAAGAAPVASVPPAEGGDERIECAVDGAAAFERGCLVERSTGPEGLVLTVRHPGGGFRRLRVTKDGRGVVAADGAEAAAVRVLGERLIEVEIAGDRYRLPATVGK